MNTIKQDMIGILDLGSTENTTLARAIRNLGVYSEIYPHDVGNAELKAMPNLKGIILYGGVNNVVDGNPIEPSPVVYETGVPVMAIGYPAAKCEKTFDACPADEAEALKMLSDFVLVECGAKKN